MNTTENRLLIIERPNDRKWPYVIGGFVAGVANIIGLACAFGDDTDDTYCESPSCNDEEMLPSNDETETEEIAGRGLNSLFSQANDITQK